MKLLAIESENEGEALRLLKRGFPKHSRAEFKELIRRTREFMPEDSGWPVGYLFEHENRAIGVMLTLASPRSSGDGREGLVVNLSSWYVEPEHRGLAPMMLFRILKDRTPVYTNLTPLPAVLSMVERLGFTRWNEGVIISTWPWTWSSPASGSVVPFRRIPADALEPTERTLLADHERMGCVSAALDDGSDIHPLVFFPTRLRRSTRYRRVPVGHLIYARNRKTVLSNLRPITSFLLRRGLPLFAMDGDERECQRGAIFRPWGPKAFRGPLTRDRIDFAYSELVYFNLPPY